MWNTTALKQTVGVHQWVFRIRLYFSVFSSFRLYNWIYVWFNWVFTNRGEYSQIVVILNTCMTTYTVHKRINSKICKETIVYLLCFIFIFLKKKQWLYFKMLYRPGSSPKTTCKEMICSKQLTSTPTCYLTLYFRNS